MAAAAKNKKIVVAADKLSVVCKLPPDLGEEIMLGDAQSIIDEGRRILTDGTIVAWMSTTQKTTMLDIYDLMIMDPAKEDDVKYFNMKK